MFSHPYLLSLPAAQVRRLEGLDLNTLLIGRPQPGVVLPPPAAVLLPGAPEETRRGGASSDSSFYQGTLEELDEPVEFNQKTHLYNRQ